MKILFRLARRERPTRDLASALIVWAIVIVLLIPSSHAQTAPAHVFDVASFNAGQKLGVSLFERSRPAAGCSVQYGIFELDGAGEHTVYQNAELSGEASLRIRVQAAQRYGVQVGFASADWASFSAASVSLISGSYSVANGGRLKSVRSSVTQLPDGWTEISLHVVDGESLRGVNRSGFAFVKLTADGGYKEFPGRPGMSVELCGVMP